MALQFPISLAGKRGSEASVCQYQGSCEVLDPTRTYLFDANCGVIQSSGATSLPQSWGSDKGAYDIYIGTNLTAWGNSLFRSNPRLTSIYIPRTSTQCGIYAFWGATDLHTVTFGGDYHAFGAYSFRYCNNLTRANSCNLSPPVGFSGGSYGTFADCPNLTEVHVPVNGWVGTNSWLGLTVIRDLPAQTYRKSNNDFTSNTSGIQTLSRSSALSTTFEIWNAYNNNLANNWLTTSLPSWQKIDFGQAENISKIIYNVRNDSGGVQSPQSYIIESSDDDVNWTTRSTVTDGPREQNSDVVHELDTPATARYWRMTVSSGYGENRIGLDKMEWHGY